MKKKNRFFNYSIIIIGIVLFLTNGCEKDNVDPTNTVMDIEGNIYHTVAIGTQVWMVENLNTTKYNDGTAIPLVTDKAEWKALTTPAYCTYNNTSNADTINTYGRLYNWYTVNTDKLCPSGWHVPSDDEWAQFEDYLISNGYNYDGTTNANKIAKSLAATILWTSVSNVGAVGNTDYPHKRNLTGFTALPGGCRLLDGFWDIGDYGMWWIATENSPSNARFWYLYTWFDYACRIDNDKRLGYSVRCIKD